MRRFYLDRKQDLGGVSGTGTVAQCVLFTDGTVAVHWLGKFATTTVHPSLESVKAVHCHAGATVIRWRDNCCFQCGSGLVRDGYTSCPYCCASWDEPADEIELHGGAWVKAGGAGWSRAMRRRLASLALCLLLLAGCAHRPQSQVSVRSGQNTWAIIYPIVADVARAGLEWLLVAIAPEDEAIVAEPMEEVNL